MSAYGPSPPRQGPIKIISPKHFSLKAESAGSSIAVYHLTSSTTPPALADYLYVQFQAELDRGATYPQEYPMNRTAFDAYFLGNDIFVGILQASSLDGTVEGAKGGMEWEQCVGGAYYVKPNYPGRSSHICNAGFLVVPRFRGIGVATALARSYVEYAPCLGYKASVFNLVYVNNTASVRIWDRLGFEKVGCIPGAGRLKRRPEDGGGEEYVDAWVVYKSFEGNVGVTTP